MFVVCARVRRRGRKHGQFQYAGGTPALPGDAVGGDTSPAPGDRYFFIMNIDRRDEQDEQDERFLHEKLAQPMTRCGLADAQDYKLAVSRKNPVHPVHPC